jgi:hypothetical protein
MKLKLALVALTLACSTASQAGPGIVIQLGSGGGCNQRPVYCPPRPVYCPPRPVCQPYYYQAPVVYYNQGPACSTGTRFSNVSGFVNGRQGVIQVSQPVYPVQPVNVYRGNNFRWR